MSRRPDNAAETMNTAPVCLSVCLRAVCLRVGLSEQERTGCVNHPPSRENTDSGRPFPLPRLPPLRTTPHRAPTAHISYTHTPPSSATAIAAPQPARPRPAAPVLGLPAATTVAVPVAVAVTVTVTVAVAAGTVVAAVAAPPLTPKKRVVLASGTLLVGPAGVVAVKLAELPSPSPPGRTR